MKKFLTYYEMVDNDVNVTVTNCKLVEGYSSVIDVIIRKLVETTLEYDSIECTTCITPTSFISNISFHFNYKDIEIECRKCVFLVIASKFDFDNTRTYYKNRVYYMNLEKLNEVEAKKEPKFEITLYDQFKNLIADIKFVSKLNIFKDFVVDDLKLCVNNVGYKKVSTLFPSTNGDDII